MQVYFYHSEVKEYISSLENATVAKFSRTVDLLQKFGSNLGMPYSKKIDNNLYELRIRGKQELRVFYSFHKNHIVLLHAIIKKKQRIPIKEVQRAIKRIRLLTQS